MHDVVIIGAGPAGAATAHFLKAGQPGLDVLLLDRAEFPRDKTCGDGLTPRALRVLNQMGVLDAVRRRGCAVDAYEVVAPNGRVTAAPISGQPGALVVPRHDLDRIVLQRAIDSGAQFEPGVVVSRVEAEPAGVTLRADRRTLHARVAIVATGAASGVLTRSGILRGQPRAMLAARAYFEDLHVDIPRRFQLRFDHAPQPGYGWIFPLGQRAANIGVGFMPRGHRSGTAMAAFERFAAGPALGRMLSGARPRGPLKGYPIRVDFLRAPTHAPNTLLVGEAAGLVNPLTGEGIDYALESGRIAAAFLAEHLAREAPLPLHDYDRLLHDRFDRIFRFSEWIRDWYCRPPVLNALVPLANRRPELRQLLANLVLGEREPRGYGPLTMLARLLAYLATTRSATP